MSRKKIGLILPGAIWFAPFLRIYTKILDSLDVDYSVVSWTRDGVDKPEGFQYRIQPKNGHGSASFKEYWKYIKFVKNTILKEKYDKLIVFCPQTACLLSSFLLLRYRGRYMIDYRDLSIEQKFGFKQLYAFMLKRSALNVISSPGFKRCLPNLDYEISHNFDEEIVRKNLNQNNTKDSFNIIENNIDVLTIGGIRDFSSNSQVIKNLSNKENITLRFVGRGNASEKLEEYAKEIKASNISFKGYYEKAEEQGIIKSSTFLNIFYPRIITHDTALSNRFYNSLLYKKPMIVTKNTMQGDYAEKYGVGIAVENCENLSLELKNFLKKNFSVYSRNCNLLLREFLAEQEKFKESFKKFILS